MKGSDKVEMTINIGGELIKIDVPFDEQNDVRDAEKEVKNFIERLRKAWPDNSDKNIFAMVAYQYAKWCQQLLKIQEEAVNIIDIKSHLIDQSIDLKPHEESL